MSSTTSAAAPTKQFPPSNVSNYSQGPSTGSDSVSKRSHSSGSFGAGSTTRQTAHGRSNQPLKKQHKTTTKRARLSDEDAIAESNAMRPFNNRKGQTSITHLMNFSLPPRPHHQQQNHVHQRYQRRNPTWGLGSGYHAVDKARYVHANYRFIVRSDRQYRAQTVDADVHVSWDAVLQVLGSAETQATSCPICLSPPVAPRMAKCGHIFCLPCLIRYMHSTDDQTPQPEKRARWKKCPICEDSIYISEVRPVRWFIEQEASMLRDGGDVLLKLLKREPGTTLALPRDTADRYIPGSDIPWCHVAEVMDYARFMKGGATYMAEQYDQEIIELEAQEKEDELIFGDENTWTRKATAAITDAKAKLADMPDPPHDHRTPPEPSSGDDNVPLSWDQETGADSARGRDVSALTESMAKTAIQLDSDPTKHPSTAPPAHQLARHPFYFYNALPNFYLSPLDIRILKSAFGDFSTFPSTILPRVEHISTGHVVDDDLRKRAKYMAHLPYGCEVSFLECDWTDIIGPVVLAQFADEIAKRRKRNSEKEAREERDRIRAEKIEEDKKWASIRRRRPSLNEKSFSESDFQPLAGPPLPTGSLGRDGSLATTPPWGNHRSHSTFATLASPGTSPDAARTVWGTTAVAPLSPALTAAAEQTQAPIDDGWLQGWEKDLLDESDSIAMVEASVKGEASSSNRIPNNSQGGKKNKKKKITLMSTNARRGA